MTTFFTQLFILIDRLLVTLRRAACLAVAIWMVGYAALLLADNPQVIVPMFLALSIGAIGLLGSDVMKW